jgi:hypothetical protein
MPMINVVIHVRGDQQHKELVHHLLHHKLVASASIDENNVLYKLNGDNVVEEVYHVITCQSKALLFDDIVEIIEQQLGERTAVYSTPIVGANGYFNDSVKRRTLLA